MNRHTEGPWHIVPKDAPLTGDGLVCDLDTLSIRPRDGVKLGREQDDANLLAAAPELLEALVGYDQSIRVAIKMLNRTGSQTAHEIGDELTAHLRIACDAIAKARGEA